MGYEPNAPQRLRLLLDSTTDLLLRIELQQVLESSPMPFVPSVGLRNIVAGCDACRSDGIAPISRDSLCAAHRARFNLEMCADRAALEEGPIEHLDDLMRRAMASGELGTEDRKSTRLNSSHVAISYAVFCLKKKKIKNKMMCISTIINV